MSWTSGSNFRSYRHRRTLLHRRRSREWCLRWRKVPDRHPESRYAAKVFGVVLAVSAAGIAWGATAAVTAEAVVIVLFVLACAWGGQ